MLAVRGLSDAHFHLTEAATVDIFFFAVNDHFVGIEVDHVVVVRTVCGMFIFVFGGVSAGVMVVFEVAILTVSESTVFFELKSGREVAAIAAAAGAFCAVPGASDITVGVAFTFYFVKGLIDAIGNIFGSIWVGAGVGCGC